MGEGVRGGGGGKGVEEEEEEEPTFGVDGGTRVTAVACTTEGRWKNTFNKLPRACSDPHESSTLALQLTK